MSMAFQAEMYKLKAQEELLGHGKKPNDSPVGTCETQSMKESMMAHSHARLFDHCVFSTKGKTARDRMRRAMHMGRNERLQTSLRDLPDTTSRSQDWRPGLFSGRPYGTFVPRAVSFERSIKCTNFRNRLSSLFVPEDRLVSVKADWTVYPTCCIPGTSVPDPRDSALIGTKIHARLLDGPAALVFDGGVNPAHGGDGLA